MSSRILVTSNCQTGGLANALRAMVRDAEIDAHSLSELPEDMESAKKKILQYDIWITSHRTELFQAKEHGAPVVAMCPVWAFYTFHPDITYIRNQETGLGVGGAQTSRIISWAYNIDASVDKTISLFNDNVFSQLGYYNLWNTEINNLNSYFDDCGLDFRAFYFAIKRQGVFMHDPGHPYAAVLVEMAKSLVRKLGLVADLSNHYKISELWEHISWPVYPEIADKLGLNGSYTWTESGSIPGGLPGYIDHVFKRYKDEGLKPGRVDCQTATGWENIDKVVGPVLTKFLR